MQNNQPMNPVDKSNIQPMLFEQYKLLIESINKLNETREMSNNFWTGVNGVSISILAYFRDSDNISHLQKTLFLCTICIVGIVFCLTWLSYLATIRKSVEANSDVLMEVEKHFSLPVFLKVSERSGEKTTGKSALTLKEMIIPLIFLAGYLGFGFLLIFFPEAALAEH